MSEIIRLSKFKLSIRNYSEDRVLIDNTNSNLDFVVKEKDLVLVVGRNGSGKSTLLKEIIGLNSLNINNEIKLGYDSFKFRGVESTLGIKDLVASALNDSDLKLILDESMTVKNFFKDSLLGKFKEYSEDIDKYLTLFYGEKNKILKKKISKLSSGEQKKLSIISALIKRNKDIYFFDEPMNCLDVDSMIVFLNSLKELREREPNAGIIIISHCLLFDKPELVYKISNKELIDYTNNYRKKDCLEEFN